MSMPNISSSGKDIPQSMIMISSLYSRTVIFLPISCKPPRGISRTGLVSFLLTVLLKIYTSFPRDRRRQSWLRIYLTTMFSSFPGTEMTLMICLPSSNAFTFSSFITASAKASLSRPVGASTRSFTLPFSCTTISTVS